MLLCEASAPARSPNKRQNQCNYLMTTSKNITNHTVRNHAIMLLQLYTREQLETKCHQAITQKDRGNNLHHSAQRVHTRVNLHIDVCSYKPNKFKLLMEPKKVTGGTKEDMYSSIASTPTHEKNVSVTNLCHQ